MLKFMKVLTQENILTMFLVVMLIKLFLLMIDFVSQLLFVEVKIMKEHFNKNLVMTEEEIYFNKVIIVGFVKNLLIMMMKKFDIIVI